MVLHLVNQNRLRRTSEDNKITRFVTSTAWIMSERSMVADGKLNKPNPIVILLVGDVFFEVRHHYKKTGSQIIHFCG
jgi:hypothetical protein